MRSNCTTRLAERELSALGSSEWFRNRGTNVAGAGVVRLLLVLCALVFGIPAALFALDAHSGGDMIASEVSRADELVLGLVLSAGPELLEIDSYESGLGLKLSRNRTAIRILADLFYSSEFSTVSFEGGAAFEYHIRPHRVSPYFGGFLSAGITSRRTQDDPENWSSDSVISVSGGGIFGVELYVLDFVSVFAEYVVEGSLATNVSRTATDGEVSRSTDSTFVFDTKLGNDAKLGIVIYLR